MIPGLKLPIIGKDVLVRRLESQDLPHLYSLESDHEVKRYLGGPVSKPREEWIQRMEWLLPDSVTLAIHGIKQNILVGRSSIASFDGSNSSRELQVVIAKQFWGNYFGREASELLIDAAFEEGLTQEIIGVVHPENHKSIKLLSLFGFEKNGTISDKNSNQFGHLKFALLRGQYESRKTT